MVLVTQTSSYSNILIRGNSVNGLPLLDYNLEIGVMVKFKQLSQNSFNIVVAFVISTIIGVAAAIMYLAVYIIGKESIPFSQFVAMVYNTYTLVAFLLLVQGVFDTLRDDTILSKNNKVVVSLGVAFFNGVISSICLYL